MFRIAWLFFRVGALNELQYRVNFLMQLLKSLITLGIGIIGLEVVSSHTTTLAGTTRPDLLAVMGVYTLMRGLINISIQQYITQHLEDMQHSTIAYVVTEHAYA